MTQTPKECKTGERCKPQTVADAIDCLGHHSPNSLAEMCVRTGKNVNRMRKVFSLYDELFRLKVDEVAPFTIASADEPDDRNTVLIEFLCRQLGGAFVLLPRVNAENGEYFSATAQMLERVSALARELSESLRDNKIDANEHGKLRQKAHDLHQVVAQIEAMLDRSVQEASPLPGATVLDRFRPASGGQR